MPWSSQKINNGGVSSGPGAVGDIGYKVFVCVYNDQQHFSYRDGSGNLQDVWWGEKQWHLQQINEGAGPAVAGEYVATPGAPAAAGDLFVSVYNDQQHFSYLDAEGNIQDCWYDGGLGAWKLQQINEGAGPAVAGEYVATPGAPAAAGDLFVSVYNDQQHFSYLDAKGNIQDAWWDGRQWHLQKINNGGMTTGPSAAGGLFVCVYNRQHHFAYRDADGNIWDSWWDVPEMAVGVVEVVLPNGKVALMQAADLDDDGHGAAKVSRKDIFRFEDVSGTLEGIGEMVRSGLEKVKPSKTTVELGIQLAVKNGKLTGLIVEGKVEASLKVTFEWGPEPAAATIFASPSGRPKIDGGEGTVTSETDSSQSDGPAA
jgi:hypothetical protein